MKTLQSNNTTTIILSIFHRRNFTNNSDNNSSALTEQEQEMLLKMREEEKLANDVYSYLYDKYRMNIFDNISNSEGRHMSSVLYLLNKYNMPDPALPNPGEFNDPELQHLYTELITTGEKSLLDALRVGATIEDLDIYDLEEFSALTDKPDILDVFRRLTCGSRNHMRAFYRQIRNQNADYTPQYITQENFEKIINGPHERCGRQ